MRCIETTLFVAFLFLTIYSSWNVYDKVNAQNDDQNEGDLPKVDNDIGKSREGSRTDDEVVEREEEQIKLDGLNVAQLKELRAGAEKQEFVAEVNRMMKLIINSLYKNKEIFLRELISNASDALDKIRFLALTDKSALGESDKLEIRIKADKENRMLHITDTGIGMTKDDLVKYLGTIAKSQTSEFLNRFQEATEAENSKQSMSDLIGQFGVGFYSAFLVADKVFVTSKNNDDDQHIWESDSASFIVSKDPRGNTLGRGTTVSLHLKEEAQGFLEENKIKEIIRKYSQFINFNIYLLTTKEVTEEVDSEEPATAETKSDEEVTVEESEKPKEKVKKTRIEENWELMNEAKPIWQRKASEITEEEYQEFYKSYSKDHEKPLDFVHFSAEGEVSFKSILYIPKISPTDLFKNYNTKSESIKMFVRRVFISDMFDELVPKYLSFISGVVDSDDLPLNVSRETLQQNKLLKVIKKKLVRKVLDMFKKLSEENYEIFWKEYGTNIKLGIIDDTTNRVRLAKLLRFASSATENGKLTGLEQYVERIKDKQESIYFIAGSSREELAKSPFVERLLKKGFEVLYLIDPIDEYCMQSLSEFEGKRFVNVAKDGLDIDKTKESEERLKELESAYEPLVKWIKDGKLKEKLESVRLSARLVKTPMALVASQYGYSGNMERLAKAQAYQKSGGDSSHNHFLSQKKILEINPGHPLIKELLRRVETDAKDEKAQELVQLMYEAATLRSGYELSDTAGFADRIESMLKSAMDISVDEQVDELENDDAVDAPKEASSSGDDEIDIDSEEKQKQHEEL